MKKILFIISTFLFLTINVYAETHDVQAKYEKEYNVDLSTINLNNNTKILNIDEYSLEFTTTLKNIDVVVIKAGPEENNYIKKFTNNNNNYYLGFFKDKKKITNSNIKIRIKNNNKLLYIYDNSGNLIKSSGDKISLNNNNYFLTINDKLNNNNNNNNIDKENNVKDKYKIININSFANKLDEVEDKSIITIYNYKNILIDNKKPLGTGYTVLINNNGVIKEYKIVVKGDVTGDAKINLNDIARLYHYYKKVEQMDEPFILAGDVANDDTIKLNDITKIYNLYKNNISNF